MTKDMSAITTAPEGYEWVFNARGEIQQRTPLDSDWWVGGFVDGRWTVCSGRDWHTSVTRLILRKLPPPVTAYDVTLRLDPGEFEHFRTVRNGTLNSNRVRTAILAGNYTEVKE